MAALYLATPTAANYRPTVAPGDVVAHRADRSMMQVVGIEPDGRVRVRGLAWPAGFSALVIEQEIVVVNSPRWTASA